ncbi:type II toxin-antitoxin system RelE/ParE family toxin [Jiella endophytica]|uniref:Type II toxin-antitoxin system RelE/ParE family toxin n=1 Tax=Jiella endophytica TaxID=2558362 RepID=A0A4Y8RBH7_9HYPH|nr:type II toxin-antitoxin system RelE/ParE family toxin [Jiella endophytica]TFF19088.1 type II toxin-antitoxin system RelE/ParE family toxin [Jiella endophytica]
MEVVYRRSATKAMERMPANDRDALKAKLKRYAASGEGDVIKLSARNEWRLRHGDWRAIFVIENQLLVVRVAHRRDIYK